MVGWLLGKGQVRVTVIGWMALVISCTYMRSYIEKRMQV